MWQHTTSHGDTLDDCGGQGTKYGDTLDDCSSLATNYGDILEDAVDLPHIIEMRWKFAVALHKLWRLFG